MAFLKFPSNPQFRRAAFTASSLILADLGLLAYIVRNDEVKYTLSPTDPIFSSAIYKKLNPEGNTPMNDEVIKRIPLKYVKPEVLEKKDQLASKFVGGVFGRGAYGIQRSILHKKYFGDATKDQLWDAEAIKSSPHDVGTIITDHFEIVDKSSPSPNESQVVIRCGDSPRVQDVRPSDGLFVATAKVDEEKQELVLSLKSAFFQGLGKAEKGVEPMPKHIKYLHIAYAIALLESGSRELTTGILC